MVEKVHPQWAVTLGEREAGSTAISCSSVVVPSSMEAWCSQGKSVTSK